MTSEQRYEGKGNNAHPNEQTVGSATQTVNCDQQTVRALYRDGQFVRDYSPLERWQADFLCRAASDPLKMEYLFLVLERVREMNETIDPMQGLCYLLGEQLANPSTEFDRHRDDLRAVTSLIANLNELNSLFECLDDCTDYRNEAVTIENEIGRAA